MDDLISRQAAIEALKGMAVPLYKDPACEDIWERDRTLDNAIDAIRGLPSAQPEIIRCKDCRFATLTYDGDCKYCQYLEGEFGLTDAVYFDGNDYCSHAERRTDE